MDELMQSVADRVDAQYTIDLFKDLVDTPSPNPPSDTRAVAERMGKEMRAMGITDIAFVEPQAGMRSFIARVGQGNGPTITLISHLDTVHVPAEELPDWRTPPWTATVRDGRLYGRGAADAKCALAPMLGAMRAVMESGVEIPGRVILVGNGNAERGGIWGAKYLAENGYDLGSDMAIACDASDFTIIRQFKGRIWLELATEGRAVHASAPDLGINAGAKMVAVVDAIARHPFEFAPHSLLGDCTVTLTTIHGGSLTNAVPGHCKTTYDVRLVPGQSVDGFLRELQSLLDALKGGDDKLEVALRVLPTPREPMETAEDSRVVRCLGDAYKAVLKREPVFGSGIESPGSLVYLRQAGADGVFFGPGAISQAHMPNESVELSRIPDAARVYAAAVVRAMAM